MSGSVARRIERLERRRWPGDDGAAPQLPDEAWRMLLVNLGMTPEEAALASRPPAPPSGEVGEDGLTDKGRWLLADLLQGMEA
jgi:hypothetical protein